MVTLRSKAPNSPSSCRALFVLLCLVFSAGLAIFLRPGGGEDLLFDGGLLMLRRAAGEEQPQALLGLWITCSTSKGPLNIALDPEHAPKSVESLLALVDDSWFSNKVAFFRVNSDAVQLGAAQKGIKNPLSESWERDLHPEFDKKKRKPDWIRGDVTMIGGTQMVIVRRNGTMMGMNDKDKVVGRIEMSSMKRVVDRLYEYPDIIHHPSEHGPDQRVIFNQGWSYLDKEFPELDYIESCRRGYENL